METSNAQSMALNAEAVINRYDAIDNLKEAEIALYRGIVFKIITEDHSESESEAAGLLASKHGFDLEADLRALRHNQKQIERFLGTFDRSEWETIAAKASKAAEKGNEKLRALEAKQAEDLRQARIKNHDLHQQARMIAGTKLNDGRVRAEHPHLFDQGEQV